jgi:hypothetical protein
VQVAVWGGWNDADGDGLPYASLQPGLCDNCPLINDPSSKDYDNDGFGDVCCLDMLPPGDVLMTWPLTTQTGIHQYKKVN